jgi:hypothetical protein
MKNQMVVGFVFSVNLSSVVLIRKSKPAWQYGLLNGVGGKKNDDDANLTYTMMREYEEEAGVKTNYYDWNKFAILEGSDWAVNCFYAVSDEIFMQSKTKENEQIEKIRVSKLTEEKTLYNLQWLIPLALNCTQNVFAGLPICIYYK